MILNVRKNVVVEDVSLNENNLYNDVKKDENLFINNIKYCQENIVGNETYGDFTQYFDEDGVVLMETHISENNNVIFKFFDGNEFELTMPFSSGQ